MSANKTLGAVLHGDNQDARKQAAAMLGAARTPAKQAAARENGAKSKQVVTSEEHRAKLRQAQALRRERERQEKAVLQAAAPVVSEPVEKKKPGRPPKPVEVKAASSELKRGRGRPKKQEPAQEGQAAE